MWRTFTVEGIGAGKSVVVINDSPELLELAEMLLRDEDFAVKVAVIGTGAYQLVRTTMPDLVILDIRLPDISGWDILQALKLDAQTAHIPILVCSAAVQELRSLEAQLAGMGIDILVKPFAIDSLLEKARILTDSLARVEIRSEQVG
jgi:DNA-binding response OmpR family regulator